MAKWLSGFLKKAKIQETSFGVVRTSINVVVWFRLKPDLDAILGFADNVKGIYFNIR